MFQWQFSVEYMQVIYYSILNRFKTNSKCIQNIIIFIAIQRFEWVISSKVQSSKPIDHPIGTITYHQKIRLVSLYFFKILLFVSRYKWIFTGLYFTSENYSLAQVSTWAGNSCTFLFTWKHRQRWYLSTQLLPIKGYCTHFIIVVVFGIT